MSTQIQPSACASCVGCKFLYEQGDGYSNYTWESTLVKCALDRNPNLADAPEHPENWKNEAPEQDNWPLTNTSRCERYSPGVFITLDVDGEDGPAEKSQDQEQIDAICKHSGRLPNGGFSQ